VKRPRLLRGPAALIVAALAALAISAGAQEWRQAAVASFDESWQVINDTFHDPSFGGLDWAAVRRELRPRILRATTLDEARDVIRDMLARLKRSHFALLSSAAADALPGPASVPVDVRVTAEGAVIARVTHTSASEAGLAPGQVLIAIDGRGVAELLRFKAPIDQRASGLEAWRRVNHALHGGEGSVASLRVRRPDGTEAVVAATRRAGSGETITLGNLPPLRLQFDARELTTATGRRVGLIGFSVWMPAVNDLLASAVDRFRQRDGLILDLRGNPGGLAAMMGGAAGHFIPDPVLLGTMQTRQAALSITVNPRVVTTDGRKVDVYRGPLAILVDELTGSTSETFVGSLQSLGRARVFGRRTMGQALPAMTKQLPIGDVLVYAIGDYKTAAGRSLEGVGVVPDLSVLLSVSALSAGRDEVLEAALRWVDERKLER